MHLEFLYVFLDHEQVDKRSVDSFDIDSLEETHNISPLKSSKLDDTDVEQTSPNVLQGGSINTTGYDVQGRQLHSGEFHDAIIPRERTPRKKDSQCQTLEHSGEMHDSLGYLPDLDSPRKEKFESDDMHETIDIFLSSEELSQGQVYVIIVSWQHLHRYSSKLFFSYWASVFNCITTEEVLLPALLVDYGHC